MALTAYKDLVLNAAWMWSEDRAPSMGAAIAYSSVASTYGAAGALVTVLVWVYYSAQILLFGAEMAKSYARSFGSRRHSRSRRDAARAGAAEEGFEG